MRIVDETTGVVLASDARAARNIISRAIGLLNRKSLTLGEALILIPCQSVHTCFMRFPIDVLFVDEDSRVIAMREGMKPFRMSKFHRRAKAVIELPAGTIEAAGIEVGHQLAFFEGKFRLSNP